MKEVTLIKNTESAFNDRIRSEGIVCYGASKRGKMAKEYLDAEGIEIKYFCDSDSNKWGSNFLGHEVISPEQLISMGRETIIYISSTFAEEIYRYLKEQGFKYIIDPLRPGVLFHKHYDCYILGINSIAAKFYERLSNRLNIKGFLWNDGETQFCGKPIINMKYFNDPNALIFHCNLAQPYNFPKNNNYYDGIKTLFLTEHYKDYRLYLDSTPYVDGQGRTDSILEAITSAINLQRPKYADIGANDPTVVNSTYIFYKKGARGQLFEPLPELCRKLEEKRPLDMVINVGIGLNNDDNVIFYKSKTRSDVSTFIDTNKAFWEKSGYDFEEIPVKTITFNDGVNPDVELVSMDCEGMDFDILKSIDFDKFNNIKIICAETPYPEATAFMARKGFKLFCIDEQNVIFIRDDVFKEAMKDELCRQMYYCERHLRLCYC